jgi:hypothetical protein
MAGGSHGVATIAADARGPPVPRAYRISYSRN